MAGVGVVGGSSEELLDLSFLTEQEREKIQAVLNQDEALRTRDRIRLGTLRQEYERARSHQLQFLGLRQCSCCERELGRILNSGALCPSCGNRVCKLCRLEPHEPQPHSPSLLPSRRFICTVCDKKWSVDIQTREFRSLSPTSPSAVPTRLPKKGLYGSELVKVSLETTTAHTADKHNPDVDQVPELYISEAGKTGRARVATGTSMASSIVVKYVEDREGSEPRSPSTSSLSSAAQLPSQARKLSVEELSSSSSSEEEDEREDTGKGQRNQYLLSHSSSMESIGSNMSVYSAEGGKGDYDITGKVELGVWFKDGILFVRVVKAKGLAVAKRSGTSDPYVKTYLLPDQTKRTKRKTGVQRRTTNPEFGEILKNKLPRAELDSRTLWLSVWDWDRFGRNKFLGEVRLPLSSLDLTDSSNHWHYLQDQQDYQDTVQRGRLRLAIKFAPHRKTSVKKKSERKVTGNLFISIKEAQDLPNMDPGGLTDGTVKLYLLPNRSSASKKKTHIINNNLNPVWNEEFEYKFVNLKELKTERALEVTVWDYDRRGANEFIGGLKIGPAVIEGSGKHREWLDSSPEEVSHWEEVLANPGEWVERWHALRASTGSSGGGGGGGGKKRTANLQSEEIPRSMGILSPIGESASSPSHDEAPPTHNEHPPTHDEAPPTHNEHPPTHDKAPPLVGSGEGVTVPLPVDVTGEQSQEVATSETAGQSAKEGPSLSETKTPSPIPEVVIEDRSLAAVKAGIESSTKFGSMTSLSSEAYIKGDYHISGELRLALQHKNNVLSIYVDRAQGLAAADSNGLSDPYVKTYLLPDKSKHSKKKTEIKKRTLNPVYQETLKYEVDTSALPSRTLWVSVWDWDRFGKNKFLGELQFPLYEVDFSTASMEQWYALQDKDCSISVPQPIQPISAAHSVAPEPTTSQPATTQPATQDTSPPPSTSQPSASQPSASQPSPSQPAPVPQLPTHQQDYRGELHMGLMFSPTPKHSPKSGTLHIAVKSAKSLPNMDDKGFTDGYVKLYLLPDKSGKGKRKTAIIKNNLNPTWDEKFTYDKLSIDDLSSIRVLEVTVWDYDRGSTNDFVGGLRLGPAPQHLKTRKEWMDSGKQEVWQWEEMLARPGEWVECWHPLRDSMDPRPIDLSDVSTLLQSEQDDDVTEEGMASVEGGAGLVRDEFRKVSVSKPVDTSSQPHEVSEAQTDRSAEQSDKEQSQDIPLRRTSPVLSSNSVRYNPRTASKEQLVTETAPEPHTTSENTSHPAPDPHKDPLKTARMSPHLHSQTAASSTHSVSPLLQQQKFHGSTSTLGSVSSFGSMTSVYSAVHSGAKGDYEITGEVLFGMQDVGGYLEVNVGRAKGVAIAHKRGGYSNPYVKTYLLPDTSKASKQKTSVKKKTRHPVYNETLMHELNQSEVHSRTLWLSVWDWDKFGRNQFLGEVKVHLSSVDLSDPTQHWYPLMDKDESPADQIDDFERGELTLSLMFQPPSHAEHKGTLHIRIRHATNLPPMNPNELTDAIVKCYLLPDRNSSSKRKTGVVKNNLNPVWEEGFTYKHLNLRDLLEGRVLEITVWDHGKRGNAFIGGLRVGGAPGRSSRHRDWMDCIGTEVQHWEEMLSQPGEWVERSHTLRASMLPREVDLSRTPPPFEVRSSPSEVRSSPSEVRSSPSEVRSSPSEARPSPLEARSSPLQTKPPSEARSSPSEVRHSPLEARSSPLEARSSPLEARSSPFEARSSPFEARSSPLEARSSPLEGRSSPLEARSSPLEVQTTPAIESVAGAEREHSPGQTLASRPSHPDVEVPAALPVIQLDVNVPPEATPTSPEATPTSPEAPPTSFSPYVADSDPSFSETFVEEEAEPKPKPQDISIAKRSGLLSLNAAGSAASFGSMTSIYSAAGGKGDYDITGEVLLGVYYKSGQLRIHIDRARNLAAADSNGYSDPYVKTYLLPDKSKSTKKKTDIKKKTLNPVYDHTIKYKFSQSEISSRTLWLSVWDWDRFGRNQFLGEVRLPLSSCGDLSDPSDHWHALHDMDSGDDGDSGPTYKGELCVSMMVEKQVHKKGKDKGTLHITIKRAKDLYNHISGSKADSFIKCYLLPDKSSSGKRKTSVVKNSSNPVYEESFTFEKVDLDELASARVLEVTVWDLTKGSSNEFIGGLRLGPPPSSGVKHKEWMDSIGEEVGHWESVMARPGEWVEVWHTLRTTMDYRSVAF